MLQGPTDSDLQPRSEPDYEDETLGLDQETPVYQASYELVYAEETPACPKCGAGIPYASSPEFCFCRECGEYIRNMD